MTDDEIRARMARIPNLRTTLTEIERRLSQAREDGRRPDKIDIDEHLEAHQDLRLCERAACLGRERGL
jgi:hypothetical protein